MSNLDSYLLLIEEKKLRDQVQDLISNGPIESLFHIDVYGLANSWNVERVKLLNLFLRGVQAGVFSIHWEFHCPSCGGVAKESLGLDTAKSGDYCGICKLDFKNALDDNIEVMFSISEEIRTIPDEISAGYMKQMMHSLKHENKFHWQKNTVIRGIDCINNQVFREIFDGDILPLDQSLDVKQVSILFTDIKGSTAMYEKFGDSQAFQFVRDHFNIVFGHIKNHDGVAIKTIGDAVMGIFKTPAKALESALEIQKAFKIFNSTRDEEKKIEIKIGIHSGPTVVVTLNNRLDYFGTSVNIAARVQGLSAPNEVLFSEPVFKHEGSQLILRKYVSKLHRFNARLKGLKDKYTIYKALV